MIICQTLWTKDKNLLKDDFGWLSPQHHIMAWALSCLNLREFYPEVNLHTDSACRDLFKDELGIPYTNILNDYSNLNYPAYLWAIPKLLTYSKQNVPFLHVDGDVFVWKPFEKSLLSSDLIAQNLERGTTYYKNLFKPLLGHLKDIPMFFQENLLSNSIQAYNMGIVGGKDNKFFHEYVTDAIKFVERCNQKSLNVNFNIIFEQLFFYSKALQEKKKVTCLFEKIFDDVAYNKKEIADFSTIHQSGYLHMIGLFKKDKEICDWVARYLRQKNEELFLRIVALFKQQHYFYNTKLKEIYPTLNPDKKNKFYNSKSEDFIKALSPNIKFNSNKDIARYVEDTENMFLKELFKYEQRINRLCTKFSKIDFHRLKKIEHDSLDAIRFLNMYQEARTAVKLDRNPFIEIIYTVFDWPGMQVVGNGYMNIRCSDKKDIVIGLIPEMFFSGYREVTLDEHCVNIIVLTETVISYKDLLEKISVLFPPSKEEEEYEAFYELIYQKVEYLIKNKMLFIRQ